MAGRKRRDIPLSLARGRDRFDAWRRVRIGLARIPDELWNLAEKLAVAHGVSPTASVLKLSYQSLKKRVAIRTAEASATSSFVELSPPPSTAGDYVIEFADGAGASMRIQLRGCDTPDLVALGRSFWGDK
jgi:hypothetical protein